MSLYAQLLNYLAHPLVASPLLLTTLLLCLASAPASPQDSNSAPLLELEEVVAYSLPDSVAATGIAASASEAILVWSANRNDVLLIDGKRRAFLGRRWLIQPVSAAFVEEDSVIEVVDAQRRSILRLSTEDRLLSERKVELPITVLAGARGSRGWYLGGLTEAGRNKTYFIQPGHTPVEVYTALPDRNDSIAPPAAHITVSGGDVLLTQLSFPFSTIQLDSAGNVQRHMRPGSSGRWVEQVDSMRRFISLPAVPLGDGYLQTISDLASDYRLVIIYDRDGNVRRRVDLHIPLGFVTSVPNKHTLWGARNLGSIEIVGYRWRWNDTTP